MRLSSFLPLLTLGVLFSGFAIAHAQMGTYISRGGFGLGYYPVMPSASFRMVTLSAPAAKHDARVHPKLLTAAKLADRNANPHSQLRCWKYVKTALLQAGAVSSYPHTAYAKQAGDELSQNYGFTRLHIGSPYSAPVGAVLVYGGHGAGHVELRTERGFASDYRSAYPAALPFLGAYIKSV